MHVKSRLALAGAIAVLALALNPAAALASSDDGTTVLKADFVGSSVGQVIDGVNAGGAPWQVARGDVRVRASGRTDVRLVGLQIPGRNPDGSAANPIAIITVSLFCDGVLADQSETQPMTVPDGDARFRTTLDVPSSCGDAIAFINPNGLVGTFIASAMAG
jgi:hypothetical protein